jgi:hypothetical protein
MNSEKIISRQALDQIETEFDVFKNNIPFGYTVIDNFFAEEVASYLFDNFPVMEEMPNIFNEPMSFKGQLSDIDGKWPKFSKIFEILQSDNFRSKISKLTGIPDLLPDPILAGGGLHQSPRSGFLDIHVDANYHPLNKTLHRRVNIIIYVNRNWESSWGGSLELWSDKNNKPHVLAGSIVPKFNRAVIFSTTRNSWHGVEPVNCPVNESRKSLALYYYTVSRPISELYSDSSVIWMSKSNKTKQLLYPFLNFVIRILKPYAKFFRRKNMFDSFNSKN